MKALRLRRCLKKDRPVLDDFIGRVPICMSRPFIPGQRRGIKLELLPYPTLANVTPKAVKKNLLWCNQNHIKNCNSVQIAVGNRNPIGYFGFVLENVNSLRNCSYSTTNESSLNNLFFGCLLIANHLNWPHTGEHFP